MGKPAIRRPRRRERVLESRISDEVILFDVDGGTYYGLNEVGARLWQLCDGSRELADLVAVIEADFDAPTATVTHDVAELLVELASEKLIVEGA
ncbi:MAG: PqqD family protein [Actinomycetota bacterium]|jgi:hypothetical protein|nr:PqqD family protein [Actinomycetota bacterium]